MMTVAQALAVAAMVEQFPELREWLGTLDPEADAWKAIQDFRKILQLRVTYAREHGPAEGNYPDGAS